MKSSLRFLQEDLPVTSVADDKVRVTAVLLFGSVFQFVHLINSLTRFVRVLSTQSKYEQRRVDQLFDTYSAEGFNRTGSIRRIGADLCAMNHPWCSPVLIRFSLPAAVQVLPEDLGGRKALKKPRICFRGLIQFSRCQTSNHRR